MRVVLFRYVYCFKMAFEHCINIWYRDNGSLIIIILKVIIELNCVNINRESFQLIRFGYGLKPLEFES